MEQLKEKVVLKCVLMVSGDKSVIMDFRKSAAYVACKQLGYTDTNGIVKLKVQYMVTIGLII